jgi:hypothetical protein
VTLESGIAEREAEDGSDMRGAYVVMEFERPRTAGDVTEWYWRPVIGRLDGETVKLVAELVAACKQREDELAEQGRSQCMTGESPHLRVLYAVETGRFLSGREACTCRVEALFWKGGMCGKCKRVGRRKSVKPAEARFAFPEDALRMRALRK